MTMDDRTVRLSPYWAVQATMLTDQINARDPDGWDMPSILSRAQALAAQVTRLWDEAGDKRRAGQ